MRPSLFGSLLAAGAVSAMPASSSLDLHQLVRRDGSGAVTGNGLIWYDSNTADGTAGRSNPSSYTCYSGPFNNFPTINTWMSFDNMWNLQKRVNIGPIGNNATEVQWIYNAVRFISAIAKVDPRVILAVVVLESSGNLRVGCTTSFGGVPNCGIMQSYNATDKSYNGTQSSVTQMVIDGTQGTAYGPGLVQWFNHAPDVSFDTGGNLFKVLRGYNSGSINESDLSDGRGANNGYVSHIGNYLQGWDGSGGYQSCAFATTTTKPTPTPTACNASKYVAAPTQTVQGSTSHCCKWYTVQSNDNCQKIDDMFGISLAQFRAWNTYINADCTNLFLNYAYCVSSNDPLTAASSVSATATSSTTTSSTTTSTPTSTSSSTRITTTPTTTTKPVTTTTVNAFGTCPSGIGARYTASNRKIFSQASCGTDFGGNDTGGTKVVSNLAGCAEHCATVSNCVQAVLRTTSARTVCWPKASAKTAGQAIADATAINLVATATAAR